MPTDEPAPAHLALPVLLVDDERDNLDAFRFNFRDVFNLHTASSGAEGLEVLRKHDVAVIITDQRMPGMTGTEFLAGAREIRPDAVGVILTAFRDEDVLMEAIALGQVYRYVLKPWDRREMQTLVEQALERFHLVRENERLQAQLRRYAGYLEQERHGAFDFGQIIGEAEPLKRVLNQVEQVAPTASTVLLRGETGTGKELVAHAIHINSPREAGPFVKVNCAALAPGVLESELFGHEKGAFTGAIGRRIGRFELADGGTLFLDEVGDLPAEVQIKLLRVLQEREFERIGGRETMKVDVRLISATHKNLEELIARGGFRRDLYYRLNVFPVVIPPLRERPADIPALARHFVAKFSPSIGKQVDDLDSDALAKLAGYSWPGNVRELENVIERALILCQGSRITATDLDFGPVSVLPAEPPFSAAQVSPGDTGAAHAVAADPADSAGTGGGGAGAAGAAAGAAADPAGTGGGGAGAAADPDAGTGAVNGAAYGAANGAANGATAGAAYGAGNSGNREPLPGAGAVVPSSSSPPSSAGAATAGAGAGAGGPAAGSMPGSLAERLETEEREQIAAALERSGGNVAAAARSLGINRSTLYYRMRKHGLDGMLPSRAPNG